MLRIYYKLRQVKRFVVEKLWVGVLKRHKNSSCMMGERGQGGWVVGFFGWVVVWLFGG